MSVQLLKNITLFALCGMGTVSVFAENNSHKSGYDKRAPLAGPSSVEAQLEEEDRVTEPLFVWESVDESLQPWFDFKRSVYQDSGFRFGIYYNALYQHASATLPNDPLTNTTYDDTAALGIFRINGAWEVVGRGTADTGTIYFNIDNRHTLGTDIAPADIAGQIGYAGMTGTLFSDVGTVLVDLNYQQKINNSRGGFIVGRFDPNDYVFVSGYANPWTAFQNVAVLLNPSVALPDASWGVGFGHWINEQFYALGTINDANGLVTDDLEFFDDGAEFWKTIEFGWSPDVSQRFTHQVNVSFWHVDERDDITTDDSYGVAVSANWLLTNNIMPIFRAGWSEGEAPIYNKTITGGLTYKLDNRTDELGFAFNWGDPAAAGLDDQITSELFYKLQLAQNLAITPSVQYLIDPAQNPDEDSITIVGLRFRLTL